MSTNTNPSVCMRSPNSQGMRRRHLPEPVATAHSETKGDQSSGPSPVVDEKQQHHQHHHHHRKLNGHANGYANGHAGAANGYNTNGRSSGKGYTSDGASESADFKEPPDTPPSPPPSPPPQSRRKAAAQLTMAPSRRTQPRFAKLTLPAAYDDMSLVTRLWLQSRLLSVDMDADKGRGRAEFREPGKRRPVTFGNFLIVLDLWCLMMEGVPALIDRTFAVRIVLKFLHSVVAGLEPIGRLWAGGQLLDLVARSLREGAVPWSEALWIAGWSVVASTGKMFLDTLLKNNSRSLQAAMSLSAQEACLNAYLSVPKAKLGDPIWDDVLYEAGKFVGWQPIATELWWENISSPYDIFECMSEVLRRAIAIMSQIWMLGSALAAADGLWSLTSLIMVCAAILPAFAPFVQEYAQSLIVDDFHQLLQYEKAERELRRIAKDEAYRNERILFGLSDWIHGKWLTASKQSMHRSGRRELLARTVDLFASIMHEVGSSASYVFLATGVLSSHITIGTLHLYHTASFSLVNSFYSLSIGSKRSFQGLFICAAFCSAIEPPKPRNDGLGIDYETRRRGGMRIEAKGLGYTYLGSDKRVLHDINLVVEPGQTLAIVGFNGGGKTSLCKLFMGLLTGYTGSLTINGVEIYDYDDTSLHARTGCLFQDYARYPTTVAENVGVGDTTRMGDLAALRRAIDRGGADAVATLAAGRKLRPGSGNKDDGWDVDDDDAMNPFGIDFFALAGLEPPADTSASVGLSGGQWQRVALARAFMRADTADLIVFDEPSSSLDPRAEAELFDRIHALSGKDGNGRVRRDASAGSVPPTPTTPGDAGAAAGGGAGAAAPPGPTTVYISHRFSTVRRADVIAFVEGGTIVECGTHAELMARQGRYHELFTLQRNGFEDD